MPASEPRLDGLGPRETHLLLLNQVEQQLNSQDPKTIVDVCQFLVESKLGDPRVVSSLRACIRWAAGDANHLGRLNKPIIALFRLTASLGDQGVELLPDCFLVSKWWDSRHLSGPWVFRELGVAAIPKLEDRLTLLSNKGHEVFYEVQALSALLCCFEPGGPTAFLNYASKTLLSGSEEFRGSIAAFLAVSFSHWNFEVQSAAHSVVALVKDLPYTPYFKTEAVIDKLSQERIPSAT